MIGFLVVWQAWPVDPDLEAVCPPFGETGSYTIEPVWWPPGGMRCEVTDGSTKTTYPWREYLTVVLLALSVAVLRPRPTRMLASLAFFLAAMAVFWL